MTYLQKKRRVLMRSAKQWRGYLRNYSGNSLTLTDCMNDKTVSLTVSGNSVQDGTPAPDAPVEIQSCGERTANLFDVNDKYSFAGTVSADGWVTVENDNSNGSTTKYPNLFTKASAELKPDTLYAIVAEIREISGCNFHPTTLYTSSIGQFGSTTACTTTGTHIFHRRTISDFNTAITMLRSQVSVPAGSIGKVVFRISVLEDTNTTVTADTFKYEPYGYKVPVTYSGTNLFDVNNRSDEVPFLGTVDDNDWITAEFDNSRGSSTAYKGFYTLPSVRIKPSENYLIVVEIKEISNCFFRTHAQDSEAWCSQFLSKNVYKGTVGTFVTTLTSKDDFSNSNIMQKNQIDVPAGSIGKVVFRISVLEDTTVTADTFKYEPYHEPVTHNVYLPEPINGIGGVADTVTLTNDKVATLTKNYAVKAFNGSEHIGDMSLYTGVKETVTNFRFSNISSAKQYGELISSHLIDISGFWQADMEGVQIVEQNRLDISLSYERLGITSEATSAERVAACKAWLTAQYEAGTPFTVVYQLAEPTTETITVLQDWGIPTLNSGTNIITAETTIEPSNMAVEYYAKTP